MHHWPRGFGSDIVVANASEHKLNSEPFSWPVCWFLMDSVENVTIGIEKIAVGGKREMLQTQEDLPGV